MSRTPSRPNSTGGNSHLELCHTMSRSMRMTCPTLQRDVDYPPLCELLHPPLPHLQTQPRLFRPAIRNIRRTIQMCVDPDGTGIHARRYEICTVRVGRP